MFVVFSQNLGKTISADDVQNYQDVFLCPNPNCTAEFTLRAVNSSAVAKHFACKPNFPHTPNCPYGQCKGENLAVGDYIKYGIEQILNHTSKQGSCAQHSSSTSIAQTESKKYIRTPLQLLRYCLDNDLATEYTDGLTVNDIILDARNLLANNNYQGTTGVRLIVGQTVKYCLNDGYIKMEVSTRTRTNKPIWLTAIIHMPSDQIKEINNYFFNTEPKVFRNHPIAVLAEWKKDSEHQISCRITHKSNVIYRFIHD